jgi:hypothetical protein
MWDEKVGPFYECYPCRVLTAISAGKYRGRAIVWDAVKGLPAPLMDRVYASSPEVAEAFFRHASEQGWYRKAEQNGGCFSKYVTPSGEQVTKGRDALSVTPSASPELAGVAFWPYLDTFRAMTDCGTIYNSDDEEGAAYLLDKTDGDRTEVDEHEGQTLCADGEWRDDEDVVEVGGDYYAIDDEDIVACHRSGDYIHRSDAYEVDLGGRLGTIYIHEDHVSRA